MSTVRCKFYLQGNCFYGDSCRFSHDQPHRSNTQYDYENQSRSSRNTRESYYDTDRDYNDYYEYGEENYESKSKNSNYSYKNDYKSRNNHHNQRNDYKEDYDSSSHYGNQAQRQRNVKNYYKEDNSQGRKNDYEYDTNKVHTSSNRYKNSDGQKHSYRPHDPNLNNRFDDKQNILKHYENEIKTYQSHIQQLLMSNIWPFTCFHPIGHQYPIQPVGSLNLIDVSFEEIRCDYYLTKHITADPGLIHKRTVDDLLLKAQRQKEDILRFEDQVQDDIISTFKKCEKSKVSHFDNSIQIDPNSYWDMSIRSLKTPENKKSELESFSFVSTKNNNNNTKNEPQLKILMQTEVYGKIDNDAFAQDHFTEFIPIMPPPRKYCV
ncbi:uncharacterized protein LOC111037230 [Myzus persicae]|uniref:uncharacterized protein LOC111037230 n=1 Tax=Myzus persicae TaxID=13164 RepID=UPI000B93297D|nr:uncharacterized protein LOC111037230 [Myzus persicae]